MILSKDVMKILPLVASVLGDRYGVEVRIGGDKACTDGNTIHLPSLPLDCDETLVALARGYIDHESAHIRHTDFSILKKNTLSGLEMWLWNCLEDWRVERALADIYPGCGHNFQWLIRHVFLGKTEKAGAQPPAFSILNFILLTVRSWDVPELKDRCDQEAHVVQNLYPWIISDILRVLDEAREAVRSSADSLEYARKLVEVLRNLVASPKPPEAETTTENETDTVSGSSQVQRQAKEDIRKLLSRTMRELPKTLGDSLVAELKQNHKKHAAHCGSVAVQADLPIPALPQALLEQSQQVCRALRIRLSGLLQAQSLRRCLPGRHGRLDTGRLYKTAVQDPHVFVRLGKHVSVNTAVHILLDTSGSMQHRMNLASAACHAVATALTTIPGINIGVSAFPAATSNPREVGILPLVRHGQRVSANFGVSACGGTPLAESLWWVLQQMVPLKERRKIVLVVTDGEPDSLDAAKTAVAKAKSLQVEVLGIGIQVGEQSGILALFPECQCIKKLGELPAAMFDLLQHTLLHNLSQEKSV